jgi:hypothetical protein
MARREERDEVADLRALDIGERGEAMICRPAEPEHGELVRESRSLDPPECFQELNKRNPGRIGRSQEIGRRWARPGRPGGIKECRDVSRVAAQGSAEGAHREAERARTSRSLARNSSSVSIGRSSLDGCWKRYGDVI